MRRSTLIIVLACALLLTTSLSAVANRVVDMEFKEAPLVDVFQILGEIGGLNVLVDPSVSGNVSFYLKDLTVEEALDLVTRSTGFRYEIVGNTLIVATADRLRTEFSDEEIAFVNLQYVTVDNANKLVEEVLPGKISIYTDSERQLVVLYGSAKDLEFAKLLIEEYDKGLPAATKAKAEAEGLKAHSTPIEYIDGEGILKIVAQRYSSRDFEWDAQLNILTGETTDEEWNFVQTLVDERDIPAFFIKGVVETGERHLVVVDYEGATEMLRTGESLRGWVLQEVVGKQVTFTKGSRQFTVAMGR